MSVENSSPGFSPALLEAPWALASLVAAAGRADEVELVLEACTGDVTWKDGGM
jgi:hypothetical protein